MGGSLTIRGADLVLPDRVVRGDLLVEDGVIAAIGPSVSRRSGEVLDGTGLTVLPGGIDPQVHFREPSDNLTENLASGSRAAAAGGLTAFLDMPNTKPATTTVDLLHDKLARAAASSVVHYGFFIGATEDNLDQLIAAERTCGVKIFMGSSTGSLLVTDREVLEEIFASVGKPIAVHAENEERLRERKALFAHSTDPADHPRIRDEKAALDATKLAVELAMKHGARLHVLHVSSGDEVAFLRTVPREKISCEVCPQHLVLHAEDCYARLGTLAQCNPPVRSKAHADALWQGLLDGAVDLVATDHAPHSLEAKAKGYPNTPSGMPGVEWMIPLLLDRHTKGMCTLPQVARWTSEAAARVYRIPRKGRLEVGYDADLAIVDLQAKRTVTRESVRSGCGWSPFEGLEIQGWPVMTVVLGEPVFRDGEIVEGVRGRELTFAR